MWCFIVSTCTCVNLISICNNLATSVLVEKARKAYFKMKKIINIDNPCKLLSKLFDSIVLPVFFYCCEIWVVDLSLNDIQLSKISCKSS